MSERKQLLFAEGHFGLVARGSKTLTLRLYRPDAHSFRMNQHFYGVFPEGISLMLMATADTKMFLAGDLTDALAQEDGYSSKTGALAGLRLYYGDKLQDDSTIACIRFEIAKIYGEPVLKVHQ